MSKEECFSVFNHNNNRVVLHGSDKSSFNEDDISAITTSTTSTTENENNFSPSSLEPKEGVNKESYTARFERLFGKNSNRSTITDSHPPSDLTIFRGTGLNFDPGLLFAKSQELFLKENSNGKINLLDHENNNNRPYSPGHIVKGNVILLQTHNQGREEKQAIRGMEIILTGIENAYAYGHQRVNYN